MDEKIFSVSELNERIKDLVESDRQLARIWVRGELSNYKVYPSGHHYFSLKDADGALRCVMFKSAASKLRFKPQNGMRVLCCGRVSVYPRDGVYQMYAAELTPDGLGELYLAFQQLREKLGAEGLFDAARKKPIPPYPERIAVITSSAGAAVRDIIRVLRKRFPLAKVLLLPVRVQGAEAPPEIAGALRYANRWQLADLIICGRGGGSMEDLWCFNDERVARAIAESEIPVISAVGHEPDFTIADFAADLRAATPSNGAELAVPDQSELRAQLDADRDVLSRSVTALLERQRHRLQVLSATRAMRDPMNTIEDRRILLDRQQARLEAASAAILKQVGSRYVALAAKLDALSPLKVLRRGYAVTADGAGRVVTSAAAFAPGDTVKIRYADGRVDARVTGVALREEKE